MLEIYHQFKILGLTIDANIEEINKSYKSKAKIYHPDTSELPEAKEKFIELKNAKNIATEFKSKNVLDNKYTFVKKWIVKLNYYYEIQKISNNVYQLLKRNAICLKYSANEISSIDQSLQLLFKGLIDESDFINILNERQ
ncbi:DnaJ domain-containing protein [Mycoplasmatota bacterium WC44]